MAQLDVVGQHLELAACALTEVLAFDQIVVAFGPWFQYFDEIGQGIVRGLELVDDFGFDYIARYGEWNCIDVVLVIFSEANAIASGRDVRYGEFNL